MAQNGAEILAVPAPKNPPPVTWRWIMFLAALSQLLAPVVADQTTSNFLAEGATNKAAITPAGDAFTIWGLLCVLCALTAGAVLRFGLGVTYDAVRDRLWVASSGTNEVVGYDMAEATPRDVVRSASVQNPYTLGVDTATGRLFIAGITGGVLQIVDMAQ
jgi:hypothetical protein